MTQSQQDKDKETISANHNARVEAAFKKAEDGGVIDLTSLMISRDATNRILES